MSEKTRSNIINDEKGIALLFSLGFLSLMLVLVLSFAANAIIEQKATANNVDSATARALAQSSISKIASLMEFYSSNMINCSHDEWSSNANTSDWIHHLETAEGNSAPTYIFEWSPSYTDISWEYVEVDGKLIGRYAYVVLPMNGIDPANLVKSGLIEYDDANNTSYEERVGVSLDEINIYNISPGNITQAEAEDFSYVADGGVFTGSWADFPSLFSTLGITDATDKARYQRWFLLNSSDEKECFWLDDDGDGVVDIDAGTPANNEIYHRFNLARTDWDDLDGDADTTDYEDHVDIILGNATDWSNAAHDGTGIPWLANWSDQGDFPTLEARKKQIAANLIDYCDSNDRPCHDWGGAYTTGPSYVGLDKCPYLNEVTFCIDGTPLSFDSGTSTWSWPNTNLNFHIELVYPYEDSVNYAEPYAKMRLDVTFRVYVGGIEKTSITKTYTYTYNGDFYGSSGVPPQGYLKGNAKAVSVAFPINSVAGSSSDTTSVTATFDEIKVYLWKTSAMNDLLDYAEIIEPTSPITITGIETTDPFKYVSFEANDPRHNHFPSCWTMCEGVCSSATDAGTRASPYRNTACKPYLSGDSEGAAGDDPFDVSTMYVRNDGNGMLSPWELGAIHRAGTWETINLKNYDTNKAASPTGGGGAYADGDANLLDQIKMTSDPTSCQKFNLKTQSTELLTALFKDVVVGGYTTSPTTCNDYANPGHITSRQIGATDAEALANAVKAQNVNFLTRGQLATVSELFDGTTCGFAQGDDALKECIIGKTANLCGVSDTNYYTIIGLAQMIKDIGDGVTIVKDLDRDGAAGEATAQESGNLDINGDGDATDTTGLPETVSNCQYGVYDQYADAILAEQKIRADVYRDPSTNKTTIIRYEFLGE